MGLPHKVSLLMAIAAAAGVVYLGFTLGRASREAAPATISEPQPTAESDVPKLATPSLKAPQIAMIAPPTIRAPKTDAALADAPAAAPETQLAMAPIPTARPDRDDERALRIYGAPPRNLTQKITALIDAYPDHLAGQDGVFLYWKDGTKTPISDGRVDKTFQELLDTPDIDDMFAFDYPIGPISKDGYDDDPGRIRHQPFFTKIYGDCRVAEPELVEVAWPVGDPVQVSPRAAPALKRVAARLKALPEAFAAFIGPSAGVFKCRSIAGTTRLSVHAFAAAIDINIERSHYWRWDLEKLALSVTKGPLPWRNTIPQEVVDAFEAEGFIWGGRWRHYDTMHFEYRPELIATATPKR